MKTETERAPWHDTAECPNCCGPVVPFGENARPHRHHDVTHVKCVACGRDWREARPEILARVWWSFGAWDGRQFAEDRAR